MTRPTAPNSRSDVPPIDRPLAPDVFAPEAFTLTADRAEVRCPGGATTRTRSKREHGWRFHFRPTQCRACPLRGQCLRPDARGGRTVIKTDYEAQYRAAQQRAQTLAYQEVRREHPRIERKLADLIRWHHGRRVRYRGRLRVKVQYLLTAVVVNCKRITGRGNSKGTESYSRRTPDAFAVWVAMASISGGDRQS